MKKKAKIGFISDLDNTCKLCSNNSSLKLEDGGANENLKRYNPHRYTVAHLRP